MDHQRSQITFEFLHESLPETGNESHAAVPLPEPSAPLSRAATRGRRSLREVAMEAELVDIPDDETLLRKQYYSIGEVAAMFRANTSLIRYWENEFDIIEPRKNRKGDRFFKPSDIRNLEMIHDLLRRRKFTLEGAKDYIRKNRQAQEKHQLIQSLQKLRGFLLQVKASL